MQCALAIHQGHGHTVDLGLYPDILARAQPGRDGLLIQAFFQAGMDDWMGQVAACAGQRVVRHGRCLGEALAPVRQALARLVVKFIADWGLAQPMVAVVP